VLAGAAKVLAGAAKVLAGAAKVLAEAAKVLAGTEKVLAGPEKMLAGAAKVLAGAAWALAEAGKLVGTEWEHNLPLPQSLPLHCHSRPWNFQKQASSIGYSKKTKYNCEIPTQSHFYQNLAK
jgi:hypothetical protein